MKIKALMPLSRQTETFIIAFVAIITKIVISQKETDRNWNVVN